MARPTDFHPTRAHLVSVAIFAFFILMAIGRDWWLAFLFLIPAIFAYWVLVSRTRVDESGISTRYAFSKGKTMRWEDFTALRFKGATAYAVSKTGETVPLPGVTFNTIPRFSIASGGRIPDVIASTLEDMVARDPLAEEAGTLVDETEQPTTEDKD